MKVLILEDDGTVLETLSTKIAEKDFLGHGVVLHPRMISDYLADDASDAVKRQFEIKNKE